MKLFSAKQLSVLLASALLFCHGAFGAVHLVCDPPECADGVGHAADHHPATGASTGAHEHPAGHGMDTEYFAVVAGLIGLLLSLLPKGSLSWVRLDIRRPPLLRQASTVFRPARAPTSPVLQVFRL
jgi:hypothetical protein